MSLKELEDQIMNLDLKDRAMLARRLLQSLDDLSESEIEALWVEEGERRLDEMKRGDFTEIPAEEVMRWAQAAIS